MRWTLGGIFLLLIGITFQLGLLVYSMYALLGVILLSRFLAREWIERVSATRECNRDVAEIGDKIAVVVEVRNEGSFPVPWLLLEDSFPKEALAQKPPRVKMDGRRIALVQIRSGKTQSLLYQMTFLMRGYYQVGPLLMESGDLFGLHRRYKVVTEPHFILVYPKVVPIAGYDFASRRPIGEIRMSHKLFEDPTRVAGVRPYQQGDAFNRIHWKATARTGELHSRIFDPSSVAGATIVLDFHREMYPAQSEPVRSELAVTTAVSLANAVCTLGQQIGFVSNGRDAADRIQLEGWNQEFQTRDDAKQNSGMKAESDRLQPVVIETRRGIEQFQRIRETLARLEFTDGLDLAHLLVETSSRLPRDATIIVILGEVTTETALALGNLKRSGFAITAIVVFQESDSSSMGDATGTRFIDSSGMVDKIGRLIAEGIDVRHIDDEAGVGQLCSSQLIR